MKINSAIAGAALAITIASAPVKAAVWDFSFTDSVGDIATGLLTTTGVGFPYTVTGISGLFDGIAITGLSPYAGADQLLLQQNAPQPDTGGISFDVNGVDYNWSNFESYLYPLGSLAVSTLDPPGTGCCQIEITSATISAVPEIGTWAMMLLGFAGLSFAGYRGFRKDAALTA